MTGLDRRVAGARGWPWLPRAGAATRARPPRWSALPRPSRLARRPPTGGRRRRARGRVRPAGPRGPRGTGRTALTRHARRLVNGARAVDDPESSAVPSRSEPGGLMSVTAVETFYGLLALVGMAAIALVVIVRLLAALSDGGRRRWRGWSLPWRPMPTRWPGSWRSWRRLAASTSPRSRASTRAACAGTSASRCTRSWYPARGGRRAPGAGRFLLRHPAGRSSARSCPPTTSCSSGSPRSTPGPARRLRRARSSGSGSSGSSACRHWPSPPSA